MLHAAVLEIPHPAGGRRRFEALPPPDMAEPLRSLGLEPPQAPQS
jgi:tRNA pseudouridine32 synthase/23S rRNA pseudouridine746 synthase